eukprot:s768_g3.t3
MGLEIAHRFPHSPCSLERPFSRPEEWSWRCCWLLQAVLLGFVVAEDNGRSRMFHAVPGVTTGEARMHFKIKNGHACRVDNNGQKLQVKVAPQLHQALAGIKNIHVLGLLGTQ